MGESSFEVIGELARFRLTGEQVLESGVRQIADAIALTRDAGLDKLMVDITTITGVEPPSVLMRYWLMGEFAKVGRSSVRMAMVVRPEFIDADRIGVAAGLNAGFRSNVFETEAQALNWLLGHGGHVPSPLSPPA